jgi:hypothetical protein
MCCGEYLDIIEMKEHENGKNYVMSFMFLISFHASLHMCGCASVSFMRACCRCVLGFPGAFIIVCGRETLAESLMLSQRKMTVL